MGNASLELDKTMGPRPANSIRDRSLIDGFTKVRMYGCNLILRQPSLRNALQGGSDHVRHPTRLMLLGTTPTAADPALGYIIPGYPSPDGTHEVERIIEKPGVARAQRLCAMGALWNTFIFAARGSALLAMLRDRL